MEHSLVQVKRKSLLVPQVCELLGVSRRTVYYWIEKNLVQFTRVRGSVRVYQDSLMSGSEIFVTKSRRGRRPQSSLR